MSRIRLTIEQARRFILSHQGLYPPYAALGKDEILSFICRVGCIQYDPLNIVGRNPDLVLQARISDYSPEMLQDLLYQERKLVDGWDKMMSIYRLEDWPYFRRFREAAFHDKRAQSVEVIMPEIRHTMEERGPLSSLDLEFDHRVDWPWGPARSSRAALENMFFRGELVVHHRKNTRRIYDLVERHIPKTLLEMPEPNPTHEEYLEWHIHRRIGSIGLIWNRAGEAWLGVIGAKAGERRTTLERLIEKERIFEVAIEGLSWPCYFQAESRHILEQIKSDPVKPLEKASVLAPLDNLLWDRRFVQAIFNFEYRWEVYKPVSQRQYGYYVLPILYGDRFVARFEPERDKKTQTLVIKNWWWESDVDVSDSIRQALIVCFKHFMSYAGAKKLKIGTKLQRDEGLNFLKF